MVGQPIVDQMGGGGGPTMSPLMGPTMDGTIDPMAILQDPVGGMQGNPAIGMESIGALASNPAFQQHVMGGGGARRRR